MFQLAAFVKVICNFSQNIVIFLIGSTTLEASIRANNALIGRGRFCRSKMIS